MRNYILRLDSFLCISYVLSCNINFMVKRPKVLSSPSKELCEETMKRVVSLTRCLRLISWRGMWWMSRWHSLIRSHVVTVEARRDMVSSPTLVWRELVEGHQTSQNARTTSLLRLYLYKEVVTTPNKQAS